MSSQLAQKADIRCDGMDDRFRGKNCYIEPEAARSAGVPSLIGFRPRRARAWRYLITRKLPERGGEFEHRVKSANEPRHAQ